MVKFKVKVRIPKFRRKTKKADKDESSHEATNNKDGVNLGSQDPAPITRAMSSGESRQSINATQTSIRSEDKELLAEQRLPEDTLPGEINENFEEDISKMKTAEGRETCPRPDFASNSDSLELQENTDDGTQGKDIGGEQSCLENPEEEIQNDLEQRKSLDEDQASRDQPEEDILFKDMEQGMDMVGEQPALEQPEAESEPTLPAATQNSDEDQAAHEDPREAPKEESEEDISTTSQKEAMNEGQTAREQPEVDNAVHEDALTTKDVATSANDDSGPTEKFETKLGDAKDLFNAILQNIQRSAKNIGKMVDDTIDSTKINIETSAHDFTEMGEDIVDPSKTNNESNAKDVGEVVADAEDSSLRQAGAVSASHQIKSEQLIDDLVQTGTSQSSIAATRGAGLLQETSRSRTFSYTEGKDNPEDASVQDIWKYLSQPIETMTDNEKNEDGAEAKKPSAEDEEEEDSNSIVDSHQISKEEQEQETPAYLDRQMKDLNRAQKEMVKSASQFMLESVQSAKRHSEDLQKKTNDTAVETSAFLSKKMEEANVTKEEIVMHVSEYFFPSTGTENDDNVDEGADRFSKTLPSIPQTVGCSKSIDEALGVKTEHPFQFTRSMDEVPSEPLEELGFECEEGVDEVLEAVSNGRGHLDRNFPDETDEFDSEYLEKQLQLRRLIAECNVKDRQLEKLEAKLQSQKGSEEMDDGSEILEYYSAHTAKYFDLPKTKPCATTTSSKDEVAGDSESLMNGDYYAISAKRSAEIEGMSILSSQGVDDASESSGTVLSEYIWFD